MSPLVARASDASAFVDDFGSDLDATATSDGAGATDASFASPPRARASPAADDDPASPAFHTPAAAADGGAHPRASTTRSSVQSSRARQQLFGDGEQHPDEGTRSPAAPPPETPAGLRALGEGPDAWTREAERHLARAPLVRGGAG